MAQTGALRARWRVATALVVAPVVRVPMVVMVVVVGLLLPVGVAAAVPRPGWGWPLVGVPVVERRFEPPTTDYGAGHRGVDLRADVGDLVVAAGAGTVSYAGLLAGRGVVAVVHPDGLRTTYEPISPDVRVGQPVAQGAVLGEVATGHGSCRGRTTCLHWGLRRGDAYLDPLPLVAPTELRLLPLGGRSSGGQPVQASDARVHAGAVGAGDRWSGADQALAAAATGSLALGLGLLVRRPDPRTGRRSGSPSEPPQGPSTPALPAQSSRPAAQPPVDLGAERRRRRTG